MASENNKLDDSPTQRIDVLARILIALIIGIVIGVIISQVGLDTIQGQIQNILFIFLWLVIITGLLVFWIVQNKERLLKKLFGVTDTELSMMYKTGQSLLFNVIEKDYAQSRRDLSLLLRKAMAWYSWMNFRRWAVMAFQTLMVGLAGMLGTILLYNQNKLLTQQNQLLNQQNIRLDQQTYLQEAERRSSLIFLMGDILDAINEELKDDVGKRGIRDLSPQLIGRVIALSNSLRPYRYLGSDSLVGRELSPERGFLLLSIVSSEIDKSSLLRIYKSADFSYSDLKKAVLSGEYMSGINLKGADLEDARLDDADLSNANLSEANLDGAVLFHANLHDARLRNTSMYNAYLGTASLVGANLSGSNLSHANLSAADMTSTHLSKTNLSHANMSMAVLTNAAFDQADFDSTIVAEYTWLDSLSRMAPDTLRGTNHLISNYYMDSVETNLGWFYVLLKKPIPH